MLVDPYFQALVSCGCLCTKFIVSLTAAQKSEQARDITETHSQLFITPSLSVTVVFTDAIKHVGDKKVSRSC